MKQVVSPFLGISEDRSASGPMYTLGKGLSSRAAGSLDNHTTGYVLLGPDPVPRRLLLVQARADVCVLMPPVFRRALVSVASSSRSDSSPGTQPVPLWWRLSGPHLCLVALIFFLCLPH